MSHMEIVILAWVCDRCGLECIVADDNMPEGWQEHPSGSHVCAVCATPRPVLEVVR